MNFKVPAAREAIADPIITVSAAPLSPATLFSSSFTSSSLAASAPTWATINTPKRPHLGVLDDNYNLLISPSSANWAFTPSPLGPNSGASTSTLRGFPGTKSIGPLPFQLSGLKGALHFDDDGNLLENELLSSPVQPDSPAVVTRQRFGRVTATTRGPKPSAKGKRSIAKKPGNKENRQPGPHEEVVEVVEGSSEVSEKKRKPARRAPGRPRTRPPSDLTAVKNRQPKSTKATKAASASKPASPPKVFFSTDVGYNKARLARLLPNRCAGAKDGGNRGGECG